VMFPQRPVMGWSCFNFPRPDPGRPAQLDLSASCASLPCGPLSARPLPPPQRLHPLRISRSYLHAISRTPGRLPRLTVAFPTESSTGLLGQVVLRAHLASGLLKPRISPTYAISSTGGIRTKAVPAKTAAGALPQALVTWQSAEHVPRAVSRARSLPIAPAAGPSTKGLYSP